MSNGDRIDCGCTADTVFHLQFSNQCSDDPPVFYAKVCDHFNSWGLNLHNQGNTPGGSIHVWSGSFAGDNGVPFLQSAVTCIGDYRARFEWSIKDGQCEANYSWEGNFACGGNSPLLSGIETVPGACCGVVGGVALGYWLDDSAPVKSGTPIPVPPPCSNVPADQKECCEKSGGGLGGRPRCGGPGGPPMAAFGASAPAYSSGFSCAPVHYFDCFRFGVCLCSPNFSPRALPGLISDTALRLDFM